MKLIFNENEKLVTSIRNALKRTGGFCPCRQEQSEDTMCMCKEFREQVADPAFEGYCH